MTPDAVARAGRPVSFRAERDRLAGREPIERVRLYSLALLGALVIGLTAAEIMAGDTVLAVTPGSDFDIYITAARHLLDGDGFYPASQLAGPHALSLTEVMYPPTAIPLFVAFAFLPAVLWWAVPTFIVAAAVLAHRPRPVAWILIAVCLAAPYTGALWLAGNPGLWAVAALSVATHRPALGPLVLLKPTLAPFALVGATRRAWWLVMAGAVLYAFLWLPLWPDYLTVLRNVHGDRVGLLYSLGDVTLMAIPLVAWIGRRSPRGQVA